jgi:hypothetical protein
LATTWIAVFMVAAQAVSLLVAYPASAQTRRIFRQARGRFHISGPAPWRCWTFAAVITSAQVAAGVHRDVTLAAVDLLGGSGTAVVAAGEFVPDWVGCGDALKFTRGLLGSSRRSR